MSDDTTPDPLGGDYAIIELFGHQRIVGRITAKNVYGQEQCQIEPLFDGKLYPPVLRGGAALYGVTPCTRERAFALAPKADEWYELPESLRDVIERPQRQIEPPKPLQFVTVGPEVMVDWYKPGDVVSFQFNVNTTEGHIAPVGTVGTIREIPEPNGYIIDIMLDGEHAQVMCGLEAITRPPDYAEGEPVITTVEIACDEGFDVVPVGSRGCIQRIRTGIKDYPMDQAYVLTIFGEGGDNREVHCGPNAFKPDDGGF
jgi:hypothetical protein